MKPLPDEIRCRLVMTDLRYLVEAETELRMWLCYLNDRILWRLTEGSVRDHVHWRTVSLFTDPGIGSPRKYMLDDLIQDLCRKVGEYKFDHELEEWR